MVDAADADEPALLRAAYNLKSDAQTPEERAAEAWPAAAGAPPEHVAGRRAGAPTDATEAPDQRATGSIGDARASLPTRCPIPARQRLVIRPAPAARCAARLRGDPADYGPTGIQGLAIAVLPLALATVGQAIVVISGGIDLSLGSMIAFTTSSPRR